MRYQNDIVERLRQGIAAINRRESERLKDELSEPCQNLKEFAERTNAFYAKLLSPDVTNKPFSIPENIDAIPFWIEDLETVVLPVLRLARAME